MISQQKPSRIVQYVTNCSQEDEWNTPVSPNELWTWCSGPVPVHHQQQQLQPGGRVTGSHHPKRPLSRQLKRWDRPPSCQAAHTWWSRSVHPPVPCDEPASTTLWTWRAKNRSRGRPPSALILCFYGRSARSPADIFMTSHFSWLYIHLAACGGHTLRTELPPLWFILRVLWIPGVNLSP